MAAGSARATTVHAPSGMVATADHLASSAGVAALRAGGSAVDAAVAAGAVLAVTNQHQCGMGGDLFALVHEPGRPVTALCAAGRAGSGADAVQARVEGLSRLPFHDDIRAVTIPGCVDGWTGAPPPPRAPADRPGARRRHHLRRDGVPRVAAAVRDGPRRPRPRRGRRLPRPGDGGRRQAAHRHPHPPPRGGRRPGGDRGRGPGRVLRRAVRRRAAPARRLAVHPRRPVGVPGRVGGAAAGAGVGPRRPRAPAAVAGLPDAGRGVGGRGPRPARRPLRPGLGPPAGRVGPGGRDRPRRGAGRGGRRRRAADRGAPGRPAGRRSTPTGAAAAPRRRATAAPPCAARSTATGWG